MKYFILLCLFGLVWTAPVEETETEVETETDTEAEVDAMEVCQKRMNMTVGQDMEKMMEDMTEENLDSVKCFIDCLLEELGIIENGEFSDVMNAIKYLPVTDEDEIDAETEKILSDFKACSSVVGEGKCDLAFKFTMCLGERNSEVA